MKKFILIFGFALISVFAQSQSNDYNSIFSNEDSHSLKINHYGALTFQYLDAKSNLLPGLEYGMQINKNFIIGIYAQGTAGNFGESYGNTINNIVFHEEGLSLGYVKNPLEKFHLGGNFKIGYTSLTADEVEINIFEKFTPYGKDQGLVFHPELFTELNFTKSLKVRLGLGYTFFMLNNENIICNKSLDSYTLNLSLLFGNFSK